MAQRFVQRQVALLELVDDGLELGERALEIGCSGLVCAVVRGGTILDESAL
jgi:hypothetical protein